MQMVPDETDSAATFNKRRIVWTVLAAVLLPVTLMLIGSTSHPELGFVVIALVFPTLWIVGTIRRRRSLEATDERALAMRRRAGSFSWQVMTLVLTATVAWMDIRHGIRAAEPYLLLLAGLVVSYLAALLWQHWRGL
jgi:hypothetical protein